MAKRNSRVAWGLAVALAVALVSAALEWVHLRYGVIGLHVSSSSLTFICTRRPDPWLLVSGQRVYPWPGQVTYACGPRGSTIYQVYRRDETVQMICYHLYRFPWLWRSW